MNAVFFRGVTLAVALQSCMPAPSNNGTANPAPTKRPATSTDQTGTPSDASSLSDIGAGMMMVTQGSTKVSLADIARKSTADLVVFQFAGVTCESCKTEGPYVTTALSKYGAKVSRFIVFPNQISEYQTSDYTGFTRSYANGSPYVIDDTLSVLKKIRAKTSQYFGIYVLVSKSGDGLVLNEDEAYKSVDAEVQKALNP